jgi:2,4-dienoyl-CoA reductase (NADPH2)
VAEELLAHGEADLVALARPLLADPDFIVKAAAGRSDEINTCIACNQACLDHIFTGRSVSCLVNPRAGHEFDFDLLPPRRNAASRWWGPARPDSSAPSSPRGAAATSTCSKREATSAAS